MSFLNPILLFGLAAISVPIIIHLLNRRKFQKVTWAAMRFIQASVEQNQKRMRIEDMILLALRCLLLALLALALARPAILSNASDVFGQSKVTGVFILDNSYSMGMSDGTMTRFEKAQQAAEQALESLPAGSAAAVWLASDIVQGVIPEPTFDFNLIRKVIREATLTDRASDLFPALQKAVDTLSGRLAIRKEIYLITDGQSSGWSHLTEVQRTLERIKTEIKTFLILVNEHGEHNLGVSGLQLASGLTPARQPLRFEVKVTNYGREETRDTRMSLNINNEPACDEFTIGAIPPGATRSITLFARLPAEGFHSVTARLPEDRLRADDQRTLVVRAIKEVRVLLVDGDPGAESRDGETYFLKNALVPVPPDLAADYFIKASAIPSSELSQARWDDYDAIVLANVADFSESALKSMQNYLRRGGGLIVFPGGRVNLAFYNEQLFKRLNLLPAELGLPRGQADQDEKFFTFQEKDYEHPMVSIWNDPGSGTLASARFFKAFELKPAPLERANSNLPPSSPAPLSPEKAGDAGLPQVILKYADGTPALMERPWSLGCVILFSSTADTAWNDLPVRPSFVPLIHRALGYVVARQDQSLNIRVGEKFNRRVGTEFLDRDALFAKPRQVGAAGDLRRIEMVNGSPTLQFDQTDFAGAFAVSVAEPTLSLKFATQPDSSESSLEELSPAQLSTLKDVARVIPWLPNVSLKDYAEKERSGLEFWLPIVVLALMAAGMETFLAQWFSRSK